MPFWKNVHQILAVSGVTPDHFLPVMNKCKADILRYRLPLRHALPLKQFNLTVREGLILRLCSRGRVGYGEIAPLPGFSHESLEEAEIELRAFCRSVNVGYFQPASVDDSNSAAVLKSLSKPSVAFGVESALWWLRQSEWCSPPVTAPLLQGDTGQIVQRIEQWQGDWPKEFKLKIGRDSLKEDCARIRQVLDALPECVRIKLDANRQWTLEQAISLATSIDVRRIAYVEEPTANPGEFSELYGRTGLAFALDETVQQPGYQLQPMQGLAAIVIKPTLVGGLRRCRQLVTAARYSGARAIFSSSYESAIGLHILEQLSAQWTPEELPGLDTVSAFMGSVVSENSMAGDPVAINPDFCQLV